MPPMFHHLPLNFKKCSQNPAFFYNQMSNNLITVSMFIPIKIHRTVVIPKIFTNWIFSNMDLVQWPSFNPKQWATKFCQNLLDSERSQNDILFKFSRSCPMVFSYRKIGKIQNIVIIIRTVFEINLA